MSSSHQDAAGGPGVTHGGITHRGITHRGVTHRGVTHRGVTHRGVTHGGPGAARPAPSSRPAPSRPPRTSRSPEPARPRGAARQPEPARQSQPAHLPGADSLPDRPIGAHVPVAGGLATGALKYADAIGAQAIQIFVSNPRGWSWTAADSGQIAALRDHVSRTGLPVLVHAPYLINPGSPDPVVRERSAALLRHSLERAALIGATGVVVHTGSAITPDRDEGLRRAGECLRPLLDDLPAEGPELLLEPMAGQGNMLCATIADIGPYLDALKWHPRAALCLDTCHLFAAGHDLTAPGGVDAMMAELARVASGRLRAIHANDSKDACGSRKDRHENIGAGKIGLSPFAALLHHPGTAGVPFIVETPGKAAGQSADIATLKRLADG